MSGPEDLFELHLVVHKIPHEREYRFCRTRRWRSDFAFPDHGLLVEIEGGLFVQGRHNRAKGMIADMEKYNTAAKEGWRLLRYTTDQVRSGEAIEDVLGVLGAG